MINGKDVKCDGCWAHEYIDVIGFKNKIAKIKELGWVIRKIKRFWHHYCPDCAEERKIK